MISLTLLNWPFPSSVLLVSAPLMIFLTSSPAFRPSHKDLPGPNPLLYLLEQTCAMPCLASILSSATLPETKQNLATYSQRCEVLLSKGHSALKSTLPPILWPTAVSPATASSQGWLCYFCSFFNFLCRRFVLKFRLFSLMHLIIKKILFCVLCPLVDFGFFLFLFLTGFCYFFLTILFVYKKM